MLIGIDPLLTADLLHTLAAMGHGEHLTIVDANYPATRGRRLISTRPASTRRACCAPFCRCCRSTRSCPIPRW
jgi:L-fucose mutarotase